MTDLKPGRELDALVATKVMGRSDDWTVIACPHYSTDIAAAWDVLLFIKDRFQQQSLTRDWDSGYWTCRLGGWGQKSPVVSATAAEAPHAICLAALKAVGA